jgi:hypothetical protein
MDEAATQMLERPEELRYQPRLDDATWMTQ